MKATLPEYPTNDSAITFKDRRVPGHWPKYRLRFLLQSKISNGLFKKAEFWGDEGAPIVNVGDVYVNDDIVDLKKLSRVQCTEAELKTYEVKHGDIFFVRSSLKLEGIGKPAVVLNPTEPTVFECHLVGGRPDTRKVDPRFLIRFLNSAESRSYLVACAKTATMTTIEQMRIKDLDILCPPIPEQKQIVAFLDRETAKIDRLMEVRRKQVERLQEQRTAVIHHAVTRGLESNSQMKPSGVEWLPEVPKGWIVKRLKYWAKHISAQVSALPNDHTYLALEHVESKTGRILPNEDSEFDSNVKLFKANDVLFGRLRPYLAKVAMPEFDGVCVGELMVLRPDKQELRPRYLQLRLLTPDFISLVDGSTQGAKMPRANWTFVGNIPLAFPLPEQQDAIIAHIERETSKLDTLAAKYRRELELLAEYRASLISHAVTGKIDVRGMVPVEGTF